MYCPECRSEFRPGFTRCESCNVELVDELDLEKIPAAAGEGETANTTHPACFGGPMVDYCGFVALEDAREARDRLRTARIISEVVIRDVSPPTAQTVEREEYWLRVPVSAFKTVAGILGFDSAVEEDDDNAGSFRCSGCGSMVANDESFCPACGARFED